MSSDDQRNLSALPLDGEPWRKLLDELDQVRARISDLTFAIPVGDVYDLLSDAKSNLAMAQDLIEAEWS